MQLSEHFIEFAEKYAFLVGILAIAQTHRAVNGQTQGALVLLGGRPVKIVEYGAVVSR